MKLFKFCLFFCIALGLSGLKDVVQAQNVPVRAETPQISAGALNASAVEDLAADEHAVNPDNQNRIQSTNVFLDEPVSNAAAPPLASSIESLNFDSNAQTTGVYQIPPDPAGAAGPNHVVAVVNASIEWYTKNGVRQNRQSLRNFFAPLTPLTATFDPKVIFDPNAQRFVVVTLERTDTVSGAAANTSRILLAVSDDSDPNGVWYYHAINSAVNFNGADHWADFPGFAADDSAVYVTTNMFRFGANQTFGGLRLWIIPKSTFYNGLAATSRIFDPIALASANPNGSGAVATTAQPTLIFGALPGNTGTGTFLVQYSGLTGGGNEFLGVIRVDNPLDPTPTFTGQFIGLGDIENSAVALPGAPQAGTLRTINTNDRRVSQHAVWRNNFLYLTAPTFPTSGLDANQVTVRWWQLNTSNFDNLTIARTGLIGAEDIAPGAYTFFPSIAVNRIGDISIGFAASAPSIFPGAYYATILTTDTATTPTTTGTLRAGLDYYVRSFSTNPAARNRWGDYTGTFVDPINDYTFWVYNEYALPRGTIFPTIPNEDGRWGTAFGSFAAERKLSLIERRGNDRWGVSTINPDGSNRTVLSEVQLPSFDYETPKYSPDRTKIAWLRYENYEPNLFVMNADGSSQRRLTSNFAYSFAWSGDSSALAFTSYETGQSKLFAINADGSNLRLITDQFGPFAPAWSPDNRKIAFTGFAGNRAQIYTLSPDGTQLRNVSNSSSSDYYPEWSPDGKKIAFKLSYNPAATEIESDIFVINADGSGRTNVSNAGDAYNHKWAPDSNRIAFFRWLNRRPDLFVASVAGGNVMRLSNVSGLYGGPAWSPDGTRVAFTSNFDLYLVNANGTNLTNVTNSQNTGEYFVDW